MFDQIEDGFSNISSGLKKLHYCFPLKTSNSTTTFSLALSTPHHPNLSTPTHYPKPTTQKPIAAIVVVSLTAKAPTLNTNPTLTLLQSNRVAGYVYYYLAFKREFLNIKTFGEKQGLKHNLKESMLS